jgi:hypothetical protein
MQRLEISSPFRRKTGAPVYQIHPEHDSLRIFLNIRLEEPNFKLINLSTS